MAVSTFPNQGNAVDADQDAKDQPPRAPQSTTNGSIWKINQLVVFAWIIEFVGVSCGAANSALTTFGTAFPTTVSGWLPATPLAAIAATELLRVPFAQAVVRKRSFIVRSLAVAGLIALTALAFENWAFGLERVVSIRLANVAAAQNQVNDLNARMGHLEFAQQERINAKSLQRTEIEKRLSELGKRNQRLDDQRNVAEKAHQENLVAIRNTCLKTKANDNCALIRSKAEDARYADELQRLSTNGSRSDEDTTYLERQLADLANSNADNFLAGSGEISKLKSAVAMANSELRDAAESNQIYRLASMWFKVPVEELTQEQFSTARGFFCAFGSALIALAGSVAAMIGTCADRDTSRRTSRFSRINRALFVLIKKKPRIRTITQVVEKPVIEYVQKVIRHFIYVPVHHETGLVMSVQPGPIIPSKEIDSEMPILRAA